MYLQIPSFPNPYSTTQLTNAYLFISHASFDFITMTGRLQISIYADATSVSQGLPPITNLAYPISLADPLNPNFQLPDLETMISDNPTVWANLLTIFYGYIAKDPKFTGSTVVNN